MCGSEITPKPQGLSASDLALFEQSGQVLAGTDVPPSPCVSICRMSDDTGLCAGCWRTLNEIAAWGQSSPGDKRAVWMRIGQRLAEAQQAHTS